jgi:hypothetical protein
MGNFISNTANSAFSIVTWGGVLAISSFVLFNYSSSRLLTNYVAPASDSLTPEHVSSAISAARLVAGVPS